MQTTMRAIELSWLSPEALIVYVDRRKLDLVGYERPAGDEHWVIEPQAMQRWGDGEPLDPAERDSILSDVLVAGRARGWSLVLSA
jgi:hypothetical protein